MTTWLRSRERPVRSRKSGIASTRPRAAPRTRCAPDVGSSRWWGRSASARGQAWRRTCRWARSRAAPTCTFPTVRPLPVIHRTVRARRAGDRGEGRVRRAARALRGRRSRPGRSRARRTGSCSKGSRARACAGSSATTERWSCPRVTGATRRARRTICSARSRGSTRRDATARTRSRSRLGRFYQLLRPTRDGAHALPAAPAGVRGRHREGARARRTAPMVVMRTASGPRVLVGGRARRGVRRAGGDLPPESRSSSR